MQVPASVFLMDHRLNILARHAGDGIHMRQKTDYRPTFARVARQQCSHKTELIDLDFLQPQRLELIGQHRGQLMLPGSAGSDSRVFI